MDRRAVGFFALVVVLCAPGASRARLSAELSSAPIEIHADEVEYERGRDIFVARGNVHLTQEDRELSADWLSFSQRGGRGVASGHVVYSESGETVYSSFVEFSLTTRQGVLYLARFEDAANRFRMEGEEVVKTGADTYTFKKGKFTTCQCPDDGAEPWQIRSDHTDLEIEGYAVSRNTTVNVLGVPVLWMPWMAYPIATERKSGFLLPEFDYRNRTGFQVGLPYFWAARPNLNLTMTPRWLEKRGVKGEVNAEYLLGEHSSGEISGSYIHDRDIDSNSLQDPYDDDRWSVKGKQDFHLPKGWRFQSDFKAMSDNDYAFDFQDLARYRRDRFLYSNAFVTKHLGDNGRAGFVGSVSIADDIQTVDNQDRDDYLLQRLPNLEFTVLPARSRIAKQLVPSLDVQYTNFGQWHNPSKSFDADFLVGDDFFYDVGIDAFEDDVLFPGDVEPTDVHKDNFSGFGGPEKNGVFDEGEPLADRGHRIQVAPRLAMPWRVGNAFEIYPEVGWRHTIFETRAQGLEEWGAFTARVDLRTRLKRFYAGGITHIMEPRIGYGLLAVPDISSDPVFVPFTRVPQQRIRQQVLNNVTRDESDRIEDFNGITWGMGHRFYRRATDKEGPRLLADLNILAQYNFSDGGDMGNVILDGVGELSPRTRFRFNVGFDPEEFQFDEALAEVGWSNGRKWTVRASYRYIRQIPLFFEDFVISYDRFDEFKDDFNHINQAGLQVIYRITENWSARYQLSRSLETKIWLSRKSAIEYESKCECWAAGIELRQDRQGGFDVGFSYRIVGLGKDLVGRSGGGFSGFGFLDGI